MKIKDDKGREYVLIDDALVDIAFYFLLTLSATLAALIVLLLRLP